MFAVPVCASLPAGVYKPRRAQSSPFFRLVSDHFRAFHAAYDERFAATYGGYLLAFSCKAADTPCVSRCFYSLNDARTLRTVRWWSAR